MSMLEHLFQDSPNKAFKICISISLQLLKCSLLFKTGFAHKIDEAKK